MNKSKKYILILLSLLIPVFLYNYLHFLKTICFYGDDIYIYMARLTSNKLSDVIQSDRALGKFRPLHSLSTHLLFAYAQKNVSLYYLFNISVQTINVFLFANLLNLFLRSPFLSLFISLIIGVSRFSIFNITQLYNGGALEGLAITFTMLTLFFLFRPLERDDQTTSKKIKDLFVSILFANICMYTHERYIVLLPFIMLVVLLFPALKTISLKQKLVLSAAVVLSIVLNIAIKKYILDMPFLVGTGGTNISFSFSTAFSFLIEGLLAIFQVNIGPGYLAGITFGELPLFYQVLVGLLLVTLLSILVLYIIKIKKTHTVSDLKNNNHFWVLLSLLVLFFFLLVPAVVTIRLEHRWLQASFDILVLMIAIIISNLHFKKNYKQYVLYVLAFIPLLLTNSRYLHQGFPNIYLYNSQQIAISFKEAVDKDIIHSNTSNLYVWVKQRDLNNEQGFKWALGEGAIFQIYQNKSKKIIFVDSIYERTSTVQISSFPNFNKNNDQIIYMPQSRVFDITNEYLQDSLKNFTTKKIYKLDAGQNAQYDQKDLKIENSNFDQFAVDGFYQNEDGIRWTNGKAEIGFKGDFNAKDTLHVLLNTYMPAACKKINPAVTITDDNNKVYQPLSSKREGDKFLYDFYFNEVSFIQKINISSDTIPVVPPDTRVLSFPFISIELKSKN